jgi:hypothetical protein
LSASANRQIARFERIRALPVGEVAHSLRRWSSSTRQPSRDVAPFYGCDETDLRDGEYHVRTLLEIALQALRTKARRELRAVIEPADDRILRRTVNNPFESPDLPWWKRRIEI